MTSNPRRAIIWTSVSSQPQAAEDKMSLLEQERLCRSWCDENGYVVIDTLTVPGHSRYESDIIDLLDDYSKRDVMAYHRLREHWKRQDFDVLVCYHDSRFGRSTTAYHWVGENVIRSGRSIYRIQGGWITRENAPFQLALGSIAATNSVTQLVEGRKAGMRKRLQKGLLTGSIQPLSHHVTRDEMGNAIRVQVREDLRRLWDNLFTVVVTDKVSWWDIEQILYEQFGHAATDGKAYREQYFYHLVHNPAFHGNNAMNIHHRKLGQREKFGLWIFDQSVPVPEGVQIEYNKFPAVYQGQQLQAFQDELRRRKTMLGSARPHKTHLFTGLLVCAECSYTLVYIHAKSRAYYYCATNYRRNTHRHEHACTNSRHMRVDAIQEWLDARLREVIRSGDINIFLPAETDPGLHIKSLQREIAALEEQQRGLIRIAVKLPENAQETVLQEINITSEQLTILQKQLDAHQYQEARANRSHLSQQQAILDIQAKYDNFWSLPEVEINQLLHRLLGDWRLAVLDAQVVRIVRKPSR